MSLDLESGQSMTRFGIAFESVFLTFKNDRENYRKRGVGDSHKRGTDTNHANLWRNP